MPAWSTKRLRTAAWLLAFVLIGFASGVSLARGIFPGSIVPGLACSYGGECQDVGGGTFQPCNAPCSCQNGGGTTYFCGVYLGPSGAKR
jgi:hypothetical protein